MMKLIFSVMMVLNFSAAWAEEEVAEAPQGTTIWVQKLSPIKDCEDADGNRADIDEGKTLLESKGVTVLATERNISSNAKKPGRRCGDQGAYVACFLIYGTGKQEAARLGFGSGGLCGTQTNNRVH